MKDAWEKNWQPTPEQLLAFWDGEVHDPGMTKQIESWLKHHPEAQEKRLADKRLNALWETTTPPEPAKEEWNRVLTNIASYQKPRSIVWKRRLGWLGVGLAAAVLLALFWNPFSLFKGPQDLPTGDGEVLIVAEASEIEIISVAGEAISSLVVGDPPVKGPLELLAPGEISVTRMEPAARDNMKPQIHNQPPMIWAKLDWEEEE